MTSARDWPVLLSDSAGRSDRTRTHLCSGPSARRASRSRTSSCAGTPSTCRAPGVSAGDRLRKESATATRTDPSRRSPAASGGCSRAPSPSPPLVSLWRPAAVPHRSGSYAPNLEEYAGLLLGAAGDTAPPWQSTAPLSASSSIRYVSQVYLGVLLPAAIGPDAGARPACDWLSRHEALSDTDSGLGTATTHSTAGRDSDPRRGGRRTHDPVLPLLLDTTEGKEGSREGESSRELGWRRSCRGATRSRDASGFQTAGSCLSPRSKNLSRPCEKQVRCCPARRVRAHLHADARLTPPAFRCSGRSP